MYKPKHKTLTDAIVKLKNVKRSSARVYSSNLARIHREFLPKTTYHQDMKWMAKNSDQLLTKLKALKNPNVQRNMLAASLIGLDIAAVSPEKRHKFIDQIKVLNNKQRELSVSGEMSEKAMKKFVSWKKILSLRALLARTVRLGKFYSRSKLVRGEFSSISHNLILQLYTQVPPLRNTWASVIFKTQTEFDDMSKAEKTHKNILVMSKARYRVYWGDYKTIKKHGVKMQLMPKKLQTVLKKHIKFLKRFFPQNDRLIVNQQGRPLSSNALTQLMQRMFYKHFRKKIGTSTLRSIFLTHTFDKSALEKQRQIASDMHHTPAVARDFYVKTKPDE